jgi:hypothetical protein
MRLLEVLGPARGYYPEPSKSIFVPDNPEAMEDCKRELADFNFIFRTGSRYVGGFVGDDEAKQAWLEPQIQQWVDGVEKLAKVARRFPQTAYAGLAKSLQMEWTYLQRVMPGLEDVLDPIEDAIKSSFLPALFGEDEPNLTDLRAQLALSVKKAGLGVPIPRETACSNHEASKGITKVLTKSLVEGSDLNTVAYSERASSVRRECRKARLKDEDRKLGLIIDSSSSKQVARRMERAKETGAWLTATPDRLNGTELSAEEFRDSLRLRFGLSPLSLPQRCEGCKQRFTVEHAMSCKKGGLIMLRHNELSAEWSSLCAQGLSPSAVSDEPLIHNGQGRPAGGSNQRTEVAPELRGDVAAHGFWRRGTTAVFDIRVTDTDAPSNRGSAPKAILARHEEEKKKKYLPACERQRKHFTPLVFSVDGLMGAEADAARKRLASRLASRWKRAYSQVCGYVRSRLAIALVRSTSRCLRWDRNPIVRQPHSPWDSGSGLALYR